MLNLSGLKKMNITTKIIILPVLGILGIILVTGVNWWIRNKVTTEMAIGKDSQAISHSVSEILSLEQEILRTHSKESVVKHASAIEALEKDISDLLKRSTEKQLVDHAEEMKELKESHSRLFSQMVQHLREMDKARNTLAKSLEKIVKNLEEIISMIDQEEANLILDGNLLDSTKVSARREIKDLVSYGDKLMLSVYTLLSFGDGLRYRKDVDRLKKQLASKAANINAIMSAIDSSEMKGKWAKAAGLIKGIGDIEKNFFSEWQQNKALRPKLEESASKMKETLNEVLKHSEQNIEKTEKLGLIFSVLASLLALLVLGSLGFLFSRSIAKSLKKSARVLSEGASQVASASEQISVASQSLAEGASEQASAIEETSSSLEEMSSMTKQNAENAAQADSLMKETTRIVEQTNSAMTQLIQSMDEVSKASQETQKIIKDIDEVAFQTNLLALNAAVEAARAGEAGAGFAVVADEVRSLAMRAAEAAKNTASLIETTITKVQGGADLVNRANDAFTQVKESAFKVAGILTEIATASSEQADGIGQINKAIAQMDKVVQQNAANAEESASASEEMNAQAEQVKSIVRDLVAMVGGKIETEPPLQARSTHTTNVSSKNRFPKTQPVHRPKTSKPVGLSPDPEKVIPFEDDDSDFEEF